MYVMKLNKVSECVSEYQDLVFKQFNVHYYDVSVHVHTCVCKKHSHTDTVYILQYSWFFSRYVNSVNFADVDRL